MLFYYLFNKYKIYNNNIITCFNYKLLKFLFVNFLEFIIINNIILISVSSKYYINRRIYIYL